VQGDVQQARADAVAAIAKINEGEPLGDKETGVVSVGAAARRR
jgi:hypothetical protein